MAIQMLGEYLQDLLKPIFECLKQEGQVISVEEFYRKS